MPQIKTFIDQISIVSEELRIALESFLEGRSTDREAIKHHITQACEILQAQHFTKASEACSLCEKLVYEIEPSREGENESILLRLCLLLSRMIEDARLGIAPNDQLFKFLVKDIREELAFNQNDNIQDSKINHRLIIVLRTLYQRQLLRLIKEKDTTPVLHALSGVCEEIQMELPSRFQPEWKAVAHYVNQLQVSDSIITPRVHRLLGIVDHRFSLITEPNQGIYSEVYPDLLTAISAFPDGDNWILNNIPPPETELTVSNISASTYSRFVNAVKDPLLKLHEGFELLSLDQDNYKLLTDSLTFLRDLNAILKLMNKPNLALLTTRISSFIIEIEKNRTDKVGLLNTVTQLWILEQFIGSLWKTDDTTVPVSDEMLIQWARVSSTRSAYAVLAAEYSVLRSQLESITGTDIDKSTTDTIIKILNAESIIGLTTQLSMDLLQSVRQDLRNKNVCLEAILALEYCARRKSENKEISEKLIKQAINIISQYRSTTSTLVISEDASNLTPSLDIIHASLPSNAAESVEVDTPTTPVASNVVQSVEPQPALAEPIYNKELQIIITKIETICAGWEAIGEDIICRAALNKAMNELCDLCISLGLEQGARLSYEWCYWLSKPDSQVVLNHTAQIKNATKQIAKHIEEDIDAQDLRPYFQFMNTTYGLMKAETASELNLPEETDTIDPEVLDALFNEITELTDSVQEILIKGSADTKEINVLQRVAHTLRGSANIIQLQDTAEQAGKLEKDLETFTSLDYLICCEIAERFNIVLNEIIAISDNPSKEPILIKVKKPEVVPTKSDMKPENENENEKPKIRTLEEVLRAVRMNKNK